MSSNFSTKDNSFSFKNYKSHRDSTWALRNYSVCLKGQYVLKKLLVKPEFIMVIKQELFKLTISYLSFFPQLPGNIKI